MQYEKYCELLELCLKAKEKGIDVFFNYSPHAEQAFDIYIHINGWSPVNKADKSFTFYIGDYWKDDKTHGPAVCLEAIAYINNLLVEEDKNEGI